MKWPFVSREAYGQALQRWMDSQQDAQRWSTRYADLLEKYHALKLQGASIPEPVKPAPVREYDALLQAVLNQSHGKPPSIKQAMLKQLAADRRDIDAGLLTEAEVLHRIEQGFQTDDGVPL